MFVRRSLAVALIALTGCRPSTIGEAESRHDIQWLDENGTPDAIAAIGRLADTDAKAVTAVEARSFFDAQAFVAAWAAVARGSRWGANTIRLGLADPKRADLAAGAMSKGGVLLVPFLGDLDASLVRLAASAHNLNVSSTLASAGSPARKIIMQRLVDASTRAPMCRGIASKNADANARAALLEVPESARDAPSCVDAVVRVAADDDAALTWLASLAEPGLLGAAGSSSTMPCSRLHVVWTKALALRPPEERAALTVPLGYAVKRCPAELDGVLADAVVHLPATRRMVVEAIDPFAAYGGALQATCAALPAVAEGGHDSAIVRERASDALGHMCGVP